MEFCDLLISRKLNIKFVIETHLRILDTELIDVLKKAGLKAVKVGVESFDDNVSAIVGFLDTLFEICSVNEFFEGSGVIGFNILADLFVLNILIYKL